MLICDRCKGSKDVAHVAIGECRPSQNFHRTDEVAPHAWSDAPAFEGDLCQACKNKAWEGIRTATAPLDLPEKPSQET